MQTNPRPGDVDEDDGVLHADPIEREIRGVPASDVGAGDLGAQHPEAAEVADRRWVRMTVAGQHGRLRLPDCRFALVVQIGK